MTRVNLISSVGAGFSLIARRPASVVVWGLVYLVLAVAPSMLTMTLGGPEIADFYRRAFSDPTSLQGGVPPGLAALQRFQGLEMLAILAAVALVYTAIQRAILHPEQKSWFSLRLSWAELRTTALVVILYVAFIIAMVVAIIVVMIPVGIGAAFAGNGAAGFARIAVIGGFAIFGVILALAYPMGRLAMAIPMSIAEDRFRLFEAWKLTRGYGWQLLGIFFIIMLIFLAVEIVMMVGLGVGAVGVIGSLDPQDIQSFFRQADWMSRAGGWLAVAGFFYLILVIFSAPIVVAPWAEAYRRIAGVKTEDAHAVFD